MCQWKETKTKKGRRRKNSPPISPNQYYQSTLSPPSETKEFWKSVRKGGETIPVPILGSECGKMGKEREGGKELAKQRRCSEQMKPITSSIIKFYPCLFCNFVMRSHLETLSSIHVANVHPVFHVHWKYVPSLSLFWKYSILFQYLSNIGYIPNI